MISDKEKEFRAFHKILYEFEYDGMKYVLYRLNENYAGMFVSGDQFDWEFGYQWSKTLQKVVELYEVPEPVKRKIESYLL